MNWSPGDPDGLSEGFHCRLLSMPVEFEAVDCGIGAEALDVVFSRSFVPHEQTAK